MSNKTTGTGTKSVGMSYEEFTKRYILANRTPQSKGVHVVFSGYNATLKAYYKQLGFEVEPRQIVEKLTADGKIASHPAKRGAMIYLPQDAPVRRDTGIDLKAKLEAMSKVKLS